MNERMPKEKGRATSGGKSIAPLSAAVIAGHATSPLIHVVYPELTATADHLREGVRVNCVNPGTADTPWVGRLLDSASDPAAERAALAARQPSGRLVSAAEVAGAIAYLASPLSGATTGTSLAVDGGMQGLRLRPVGQ